MKRSEVGEGWKSAGARNAEHRGMLTRADLVAKGCPPNLLEVLSKHEWHHVWRGGRVAREYYWTEEQVIKAAKKLVRVATHDRNVARKLALRTSPSPGGAVPPTGPA